jgi:hypothetical protein
VKDRRFRQIPMLVPTFPRCIDPSSAGQTAHSSLGMGSIERNRILRRTSRGTTRRADEVIGSPPRSNSRGSLLREAGEATSAALLRRRRKSKGAAPKPMRASRFSNCRRWISRWTWGPSLGFTVPLHIQRCGCRGTSRAPSLPSPASRSREDVWCLSRSIGGQIPYFLAGHGVDRTDFAL